MWSGPRNISTALMRSFGSRPDTVVCDEPLYAHYLKATGARHPGRDEIIAAHDSDWRSVVAWLTGPVPAGRRVFYQKHMAHHLLPEIGRDWLDRLQHAFLIREPAGMLNSLARVIDPIRLEDTGLPQQCELFDRVADQRGSAPPVIDAADVLADPRRVLGSLCAALGVPASEAMLSWAPGPRSTDGVWARYWYESVETSTGFEPPRPPSPPAAGLLALYERCLPYYRRLHGHRLEA